MEKTITEKVTDLVSQGETGNALNLLKDYVATSSPRDETLHHSVIMLLGRYNKYDREQRLGLEPDAKDLNRIEYNLLRIVEDLKKGNSNPSQSRSNPRPNQKTRTRATNQVVKSNSGTSPIVWVLATLGGLFLVLFIIVSLADEEPVITTTPAVSLEQKPEETKVEKKKEEEKVAPIQHTEEPHVPVEPVEELEDMSDQLIENLLAETIWYEMVNGIGYIHFDATGRTASYAGGMGRVQVQGLLDDGFIHATYLHTAGTMGRLAISPQIEDNNLVVYMSDQNSISFYPEPMLWAKQ